MQTITKGASKKPNTAKALNPPPLGFSIFFFVLERSKNFLTKNLNFLASGGGRRPIPPPLADASAENAIFLRAP